NTNRPATHHPTAETDSAERSRRAIATTLVSPVGANSAWSASAAPGWAGRGGVTFACTAPRTGAAVLAGRGAALGRSATAVARWRCRFRALRREALLTPLPL